MTQIRRFLPGNEEEQQAQQLLLSALDEYGEALLCRDCPAGHITCSGFLLSPDLSETLMAYHLVYGSVGWTGGHADGDADLLGVAVREAREETGITKLWPLSASVLSLDVLPVPAHEKHGVPVPEHRHFNVCFGLIADRQQPLRERPGENRDVRWLTPAQMHELCSEPHMSPIYDKLIDRMRRIVRERAALPMRMAAPLLRWYPHHHRALPWRETRDPYRIWVSEIMLQQTRVEAVKGYYARFLDALPDIEALAAAPEEQLLKLWEGLGYYSRVRNLGKAARQIMEVHAGRFPEDYAAVRALPGVGDYTAGAVCSICFSLPTPAVDGNVLRVMARVQEDFRNVLDPRTRADVTRMLRPVYEAYDPGMLTQALMEIGATVCVPGTPHCSECPLSALCASREAGSTGLVPVRQKKQTRRTEQKTVFILECAGRIAITRRPDTGLLASLWELPNVPGHLNAQEAVQTASAWGVQPQALQKIVQRKHIFTHITWEMQGVFLRCAREDEAFTWADPGQLQGLYALPTAFRCVLE